MRILVISDIHANLTAFETVLADAENKWDFVWCLGDIVGYGPDPNECVALLRKLPHLSLCGNHDWAALGKLDITNFNPDARLAVEWTQAALTPESIQYLHELPAMDIQEGYPFTLAHASPRHPIWEYIWDERAAVLNFDHYITRYCLVGHTHTPVIFEQLTKTSVTARAPQYDTPISLGTNRLIINPGSVGQPRDSDPRAAYAILDLEQMTWCHYRVPYDISATQARMQAHNLPLRLIARLEMGW